MRREKIIDSDRRVRSDEFFHSTKILNTPFQKKLRFTYSTISYRNQMYLRFARFYQACSSVGRGSRRVFVGVVFGELREKERGREICDRTSVRICSPLSSWQSLDSLLVLMMTMMTLRECDNDTYLFF